MGLGAFSNNASVGRLWVPFLALVDSIFEDGHDDDAHFSTAGGVTNLSRTYIVFEDGHDDDAHFSKAGGILIFPHKLSKKKDGHDDDAHFTIWR